MARLNACINCILFPKTEENNAASRRGFMGSHSRGQRKGIFIRPELTPQPTRLHGENRSQQHSIFLPTNNSAVIHSRGFQQRSGSTVTFVVSEAKESPIPATRRLRCIPFSLNLASATKLLFPLRTLYTSAGLLLSPSLKISCDWGENRPVFQAFLPWRVNDSVGHIREVGNISKLPPSPRSSVLYLP